MFRVVPRWLLIAAAASSVVVTLACPQVASAQRDPDLRDRGVELEVQGAVQRVFVNADRADDARLVELLLRGVALTGTATPDRQAPLPAPGDVLYIAVDGAADARSLPKPGDTIRAVVRSAGRGAWQASGAEWFEVTMPARGTPPREADTRGNGPPTRGNTPPPRDAGSVTISLRGLACEPAIVQDQLGFRVVEVRNGSPGQTAGFQVGDVIVAVGRQPIESVAAFRRLARNADALVLSVVDVNSGRVAQVTLPAGPTTDAGDEDTTRGPDRPVEPAARLAAALGLTVEATRAGLRNAVKVVTVAPAKPAAEAGLEPGDVIVAVGETRIGSLEEFARAVPDRGGQLTLMVRDVRSGSEVPVDVTAAALTPTTQDDQPRRDADAGNEDTAPAGPLGLTTELTFHDAEAAVKITAVAPRSAAARAGLRPGWIIVKANGAAVLHPDALAKAASEADGRLVLEVIDPTSGRPRNITVAFTP
jgi:S1-C subfamily serine protease